jgi:hypothetical protein
MSGKIRISTNCPRYNLNRNLTSDCNELYGKRYISIYKNPSRESKWDNFRVDEKPYNDTYHKMDMYIKYFGE